MSLGPELYDPNAGPLEYTLDLSAWVGQDTLAPASWSIEPSGPTVERVSETDATATFRSLADGWVLGTVYRVHCDHTATTSGEKDRTTIVFRCGNK